MQGGFFGQGCDVLRPTTDAVAESFDKNTFWCNSGLSSSHLLMPTDTPESDLPWTGERYVPQIGGEIELEHVHRYLWAEQFARGKRVLDIACGEGYGSEILARSAEHVIAVDLSEDTVAHACRKYRRKNLEFLVGSCEQIPVPDAGIDLVVSFETIEH